MPLPIGQVITALAQQAPAAPAVTCDNVTISRAVLDQDSNRLAHAYEALGVRPGDFVTVGLPNGVEFVKAVVAIWKLGAVPQPLSPRLPVVERRSIIDLANPSLLVGVDPADHPDRVCVPVGFEPPERAGDAPVEPYRVSPAWKATTSGGSTGTPKLIVDGTAGAVESAGVEAAGVRKDGVVLIPGPLYHNMPFSTSFSSLFHGNHVVLLSKFDAEAALRAIDRHRAEVVWLVPTMMLRMWRAMEAEPAAFGLGSLRALWHAAAPCPEWLKEAWIGRLGPDRIRESYAGTEMQAMTTITGSEWLAHRGSVGRVVLGEMKVAGEDGRALPPGAIGEIFMRRADGTVSYRYVGAAARALDGGWESLGDVGWFDEDGYLYLSDRRSDLILAGGVNIYPAEVEAALCRHPLIESAIVVGLPDEDLGQRVHAVVHALGHISAEDLEEYLATCLVKYKIPRSFRFVGEPLRDDAGKARRLAIRDAEAALVNGQACGCRKPCHCR
jgi:bile acid-coenzyme A ligase